MVKVHIIATNEEKIVIYRKAKEQGLISAFLYSVKDTSEKAWLKWLEDAYCLTVLENGEPAGIAIFIGQDGPRCVFSHFLLFRETAKKAAEFGALIIKWMEDNLKVKTFLGITPICYRHAHPLMKEAWAFKEMAQLTDACYFANKGIYSDAILYMRTSNETN